MKNRIVEFDIMKGIAIIMVMFGHYFYFPIPYYHELLYSVHLPIFFIINGYVSMEGNVSRSFYNGLRYYITPYLFTCIIMFPFEIINSNNIYDYFISVIFGKSTMNVPYPSAIFASIPSIGALWFLLAIFWADLFVSIFRTNISRVIFTAILFCSGVISFKYIYLPFSIQSGMVASLYVSIGRCLKDFNFVGSKINPYILSMCILLWILCVYFGGVNIAVCQFPYKGLSFILSLCGVYVVYCFSHLLYNLNIYKRISNIGRITLYVLCFHLIELNELRIVNTITSKYGNGLNIGTFYSIVFLFLYLFIIYKIVSKSMLLKKIYGIKA